MPATRLPARLLRRVERSVLVLMAVSLAAMLLGVLLVDRRTRELDGTARRVSHTYDVLGALAGVEGAIREAESAERGFALTGDSTLLGAVPRRARARRRPAGRHPGARARQPRQARRADGLAAAAVRKLSTMDAVVRARRERGAPAAAALIAGRQGHEAMLAVERAVEEMRAEELALLDRRRTVLARSMTGWAALARGLGGGAITLLCVGALAVRSARARQLDAERDAATAYDELRDRVAELEARGREARALSALTEAVQLCVTPAEAYGVLERIVPTLLPGPAAGGLLAVVRASRNRVERAASWGTLADGRDLAFLPDECCALRSGRPYLVRAGDVRLRCPHAAATGAAHYVCLPLIANGEALGVVHLVSDDGLAFAGDRALALLQDAGEYISVALANLALRDRLRQQSIRDPLTGAFNRRYLEESLDREVARARRHGHGLGLLMLDVDHFKRVNDVHGHEAGDEVLRATGELLRRAVREEDVVCRYGGEEFAVLLPDVTEEVANARALHILAAVRGSRWRTAASRSGRHRVGGRGMFPQHGAEGDRRAAARRRGALRGQARRPRPRGGRGRRRPRRLSAGAASALGPGR
jgi:diguanylate cyclase (GGDEF)-like protein